MPSAEYTILLHHAMTKTRRLISMGFRDTGVAHGEFHDTDDDDLFLGVHRWDPPQGPFTYGMVDDTLVGMFAYLFRIQPLAAGIWGVYLSRHWHTT